MSDDGVFTEEKFEKALLKIRQEASYGNYIRQSMTTNCPKCGALIKVVFSGFHDEQILEPCLKCKMGDICG